MPSMDVRAYINETTNAYVDGDDGAREVVPLLVITCGTGEIALAPGTEDTVPADVNADLAAQARRVAITADRWADAVTLAAIANEGRGAFLGLTLPGKESDSGDANPALYRTNLGSYLVVGKRVTDVEALAQVTASIGEDEVVIEVPQSVLDLPRTGVPPALMLSRAGSDPEAM